MPAGTTPNDAGRRIPLADTGFDPFASPDGLPLRSGCRDVWTQKAGGKTDRPGIPLEIAVWRIEPNGHYALKGVAEDPLARAAAEQARNN